MTSDSWTDSWIIQALGVEKVRDAEVEAARRWLHRALAIDGPKEVPDEQLRFIANGLELCVFDLLEGGTSKDLCSAAAAAFQIARVLPQEGLPIEVAQSLVRLGCLGTLGGRGGEFRRQLLDSGIPVLPVESTNWGIRVWAGVLDMWLRLFRKDGRSDFDAVQQRIITLRSEQRDHEPQFLAAADERENAGRAWGLISAYHLTKAAEILGTYLCQGSVDGRHAIREKLASHCDRAASAAAKGQFMERETLARLLSRTARTLVDNSIVTAPAPGTLPEVGRM